MIRAYKNYLLAWLCLSIGIAPGLVAQEGHTHGEEEMQAAHTVSGMFTSYAQTQKYELTLKHGRIDPNQEGDLILYVADYKTNKPLHDVDLKISVQEDEKIMVQTEMHDTGVYHLHAVFPDVRTYAVVVNINSPEHGPDLMLLKVETGKDPPQPEIHAETGEQAENSDWWKFILVFLGGLGVGYFLIKRRPKVAVSVLIVMAFHTSVQEAGAHDDHGDKGKSTAGNTVLVPKETQFLFEITTDELNTGDFQPSVQLVGTIIPASGEYAEITTSQNGKITSLKVMPGQEVTKGQSLAVIQATTSLSEQVGVATETGRLRADIQNAEAELKAAERELYRLRAISDIAAKKDIQAAEARYNAAKANLESLRAISSGSVTASSGSITLKSPVSGKVGPFSLSQGSEIMAGTTLFTVTSLDKVYVEAQVYNKDADVVKNAARYVVKSTENKTSDHVRIVTTAVEVNPSNQSQKVIFELTNPGEQFKIGEFITLQAYLDKSAKSIFVPSSAISEINGKPVLFIKDNPEIYSVRYVSLGDDNGTHTIVMEGIDEKERYVVLGTYQVKMMMLNQ